MQARTIRLVCAIACLAVAIPVFAQYGHPLKGSWSGDWWVVKGKETHVLLDFSWDGKNLTGVLNPGPDASVMKVLTLTPPDVAAAGKLAVAARDAAVAKQAAAAAAAAANPAPPATAAPAAPAAGARGAAPAAGAATASKAAAPAAGAATATKASAPAAGAATAPKAAAAPAAGAAAARGAAPAAGGRGAAPALKDNVAIAEDPWLLHFEADAKDAAGKTIKVVVDGKMVNLGAAYTRVITGKWVQGTQTGFFKVVRN